MAHSTGFKVALWAAALALNFTLLLLPATREVWLTVLATSFIWLFNAFDYRPAGEIERVFMTGMSGFLSLVLSTIFLRFVLGLVFHPRRLTSG